MGEYGIEELCGCVRREIAYRRRVYRRLVREGKMEAGEAEREIEMMEVIWEKLEAEREPKLF